MVLAYVRHKDVAIDNIDNQIFWVFEGLEVCGIVFQMMTSIEGLEWAYD